MKILDDWLSDFPAQFHSKKNVEIFVKIFSKQLQEVREVLRELNTMTDIDVAKGKNLDMVGSIVALSRVEAAYYAGADINSPLVSDDIYRRILNYKKLRNTNECTYYDIMEGLQLIWGTSSPVYYKEKPERPATIFLTMPKQDIDEAYQSFLKTLNIKPGGVSLVYEAVYDTLIYLMFLEIFSVERIKVGISLPIAQGSDLNGKPAIFIHKATKLALKSKINLFTQGKEPYAGEVTIDKDPWTLNGEVLLDGSRILDSKIWKERI
nr:MAG TPA: Protein of unknown function (DUF2612) [Caudoviricetes sp.]